MKKVICLDDLWELAGIDPEGVERIHIPGAVPGHVHVDLEREGLIPPMFWRDNAEACQWVEHWTWRYRTVLFLDADADLRWAELVFMGLDTYAEIYLNGELLGTTANMLIPHRFDVSRQLIAGENVLEVIFSPYHQHTRGKRMDYPAAFDTHDRVHVRRMQCTFHWDWVNRFVSVGVWRPVRLNLYDQARLDSIYVNTQRIDASGADIQIMLDTSRRNEDNLSVVIEIYDPDQRLIWSDVLPMPDNKAALVVHFSQPELWWPNGYGGQPLYRCCATLRVNDQEVDGLAADFGIRTVAVEQVEDQAGSLEMERSLALRQRFPDQDRNGETAGSSFTLVVNGQRIFCRGANWVPADPFPSRISGKKYRRLVQLAKEANLNLLRCWGGGIYEPDAFWRACDACGVMVTQDFAMACAWYPEDDPEFMEQIKIEIPAAIRLLRNHPSLVWWSGDNENGMNHDADDPHFPGRLIAETITAPALKALDGGRPFFLTSPYRGKPNNCLTIGDVHFSAFPLTQADQEGDLADYRERIAVGIGRFMSESTSCGAPPLRSLRKFMTDEDIADPSGKMWQYHTKTNPYLDVLLYDSLQIVTEKLFGQAQDIEQKVAAMGYLQYEWVRLALEATRRTKWYCSGIQFWMYNDCWPSSGWSLVDYYGMPKAGYYAFKRGAKPLIASIEAAKESYRIWVCNDTLRDVTGRVRLVIQPWRGAPRWQHSLPFTVKANTARSVFSVSRSELEGHMGHDSVLVCDLNSDSVVDRAWWYPGLPRQMKLPPAHLTVTPIGHEIGISADVYARVVTLDGDGDVSDNYFDLLPGETRRIVTSQPADQYQVTWWNQG